MASSDRPGMPLRRMITISLLVAMALALAAAESQLPPLVRLPGIKLGLANIITLIAFSILPKSQVFLVVVMRLVLAGLVLGSFLTPVFWISSSGGILSYSVMALFAGRKTISIVGVSLAGAAAHNAGQLAAVALLLGNPGVYYYMPWLLLCSIPMGLFTGYAAGAAVSAWRKSEISSRM